MNENLPINVASTVNDVGTVTYASEVIAIIAGMAATEIDGVAGMTGASTIAEILGRSKSVTKGVKVEVGSEEASVDLSMVVDYGKPIQKVCRDVQESVKKSIEMMTGLHVVKVDVHVNGVSFEKEAQELKQGMQKATIDMTPEKEAMSAPADDFDVDIPDDPAEDATPCQPEAPETPEPFDEPAEETPDYEDALDEADGEEPDGEDKEEDIKDDMNDEENIDDSTADDAPATEGNG